MLHQLVSSPNLRVNPSKPTFSAKTVNAGSAINKKMRALQKAQNQAVKTQEFSDGRIRYYAKERLSEKPGLTRGSAFVTEYNPNTGQVRSWNESYDHSGNVNRVHPKTIDGQDVVAQHYPPTKVEIESWPKRPGAPK